MTFRNFQEDWVRTKGPVTLSGSNEVDIRRLIATTHQWTTRRWWRSPQWTMHVVAKGVHLKIIEQNIGQKLHSQWEDDGRCGANGGQIFFVIKLGFSIFAWKVVYRDTFWGSMSMNVICNCWKDAPKRIIGDVPKNPVYNACCYCQLFNALY